MLPRPSNSCRFPVGQCYRAVYSLLIGCWKPSGRKFFPDGISVYHSDKRGVEILLATVEVELEKL